MSIQLLSVCVAASTPCTPTWAQGLCQGPTSAAFYTGAWPGCPKVVKVWGAKSGRSCVSHALTDYVLFVIWSLKSHSCLGLKQLFMSPRKQLSHEDPKGWRWTLATSPKYHLPRCLQQGAMWLSSGPLVSLVPLDLRPAWCGLPVPSLGCLSHDPSDSRISALELGPGRQKQLYLGFRLTLSFLLVDLSSGTGWDKTYWSPAPRASLWC